MQQNYFNKLTIPLLCFVALYSCGSKQKTSSTLEPKEKEAIRTLQSMIKPALHARTMSSTDIDWPVGILPWDRFTLPVFSPDGTNAAVQLGQSVPISVLSGSDHVNLHHTIIELHHLDPVQGKTQQPLVVKQHGLLLGRNANNLGLLVEAPRGEDGRWIGRVDWATGQLQWLVNDMSINAFPIVNNRGDLAWSRQLQDENRFHLVIKRASKQQVIDDGKSDWLMPTFAGNDRLYVYRLQEGSLSLVQLDLLARDPLLSATSLSLMENGATREQTWQIATTNPINPFGKLSFYHPIHNRMTLWQPGEALETVYLLRNSVAAAPVEDGTWIVTTNNRVIRQELGSDDGIHLRDKLGIPIATTSKQWTHFMLVPDGNRLQVRAINLD